VPLLNDGASKLNDGMAKLNDGLSSLMISTVTLNDGEDKLNLPTEENK
jgi:X-X-X-Leu-X-X-Gly heptad repeat protein